MRGNEDGSFESYGGVVCQPSFLLLIFTGIFELCRSLLCLFQYEDMSGCLFYEFVTYSCK